MYIDREERPHVFSATTCGVALALHLAFFGLMWALGQIHFTERRTVIPIELTVVPFENLDGAEDEPPPDRPPDPEPEPTPPKPPDPKPPEPEPPKPEPPPPKVEDVVVPEPVKTNVVKAVETKEKPEKPKETREERMARMRTRAEDVKAARPPKPPRTNGRTGVQTLSDAEIAKLLQTGYKVGHHESIAADDNQRCLSLIKQAFYDEWERPPWKASLRDVVLAVDLAENGRVTGYRIVQGSTDARADASVLHAAAAVKRVNGLTHAFWVNNKRVNVRFHVTPSY
ncbi:MAG: energy transducer TonB [Kiritimatiellia bacterium]